MLVRLHEMAESPWGDFKGKPLDERGLSRFLKQYGIKSKSVRIGNSTPKGYARSDLHDAWARYLPPSPAKSATGATGATLVIQQSETVADSGGNTRNVADAVSDVADDVEGAGPNNPRKLNGVSDVADVAHLAADGCAQCGGDGPMVIHDGAWWHPECRQYWLRNNRAATA
jgi:hypothetical protein